MVLRLGSGVIRADYVSSLRAARIAENYGHRSGPTPDGGEPARS
jgi:hypothetical protein